MARPLLGLLGACFGYAAGRLIGAAWRETAALPSTHPRFIDAGLLLLVMVAAPLLAALASWLPALSAAQQDPAVVLREE